MKLHLPTALFVLITGTACVMADTVPTGAITVTHNSSEIGPFYGLDSTQNGSGVSSITTNITEGANLEKSLAGGLEFNHKTLENGYYADTDGVTLKDGVIINMTGGTATSLKGGNCINTSSYLDAILENLGDAVNVGSIEINVSGGTLGVAGSGAEEAIMGGGGRHCGTAADGGIEVNISGGTINNKVYAGTNGGSTGYTKLNISGGTINADVYGGGRKDYGVVLNDSTVTISGGTINGNVYAAGDQDTVKGNAHVTITGGDITGTVSGGGTKGSKVEGTSTLNIGDTNTAYNDSLRVADFDAVNVKNGQVSITDLQIAETGTTINVATGASLELSLSDLVVSGDAAGLSFEGDGDVTLNTDNLSYTFIVTNEMLAAGGEHTFTLMEGSGSVIDNTYSSMIQSGVDINFVLEDGTAFIPETISGLEILFLEDAEVSGSIVIGPNSELIMPTSSKQAIVVKATIPEPTTATMSLLALAALAARRRRR